MAARVKESLADEDRLPLQVPGTSARPLGVGLELGLGVDFQVRSYPQP